MVRPLSQPLLIAIHLDMNGEIYPAKSTAKHKKGLKIQIPDFILYNYKKLTVP